MTATINASTSSGLITTADTSGTLALQSNGTTQAQIDSTGVTLKAGGSTQFTVASTGSYGQLKRGTAVASTSGTSIEFTSVPSWVKRITLVLQRVTTSSTAQWIVQIGSGSFSTSGYESVSQATYSGSGATISQTTGMAIFHNAAATYVSGTMTFSNIDGNIWVQDHTTSYSVAGSNQGAGYTSLGGVLDRIRITTVGGANTFTGGSINIMYEG